MSNFEPVTLGDCVQLRSGNTPSKARPDFWNGGFPWISAKDMKSYWVSSSEDTLTSIGAAHANRVPAGTTLLLTRGMTLHNDIPICRVAQESSFNQDVKAVLPKDGVCNEFVPYLLLGNKRKIQGIVDSAGHGTGRLNTDQLLGLSVFRPSLENQKKIVEVAASLDEKIELNRKQNRTLEAIAQALFKRWFVEFEFPNENGRPYKSSGGAMQPSELGEIPVGWEVGDIYRIANVTYGFPFKSESFNESGVGVPLIRIRDLKNDSTGLFTTESADARYLVSAGDVLVGMDAEFRPHVWKGVDSFLNQRVCKFSPRNASVHEYFILRSIVPWLVYFEHAKTGTTVIHLGKGDIDQFECVVPTDEVLRGFYEVIDPIYRKLVSNSVESRTLAKLRDTLLPKLMSGELRVGEAADLAEAMP